MLAGVIFDFDGVIVDTEPLHYEAFQRVLRPRNVSYSWDKYLSVYIGLDDRDAFREAFRSSGRPLDDADLARLMKEKADTFERLVAERGVRPYRGVVELLRNLHRRVPVGLCSGALRRDALPILEHLKLVSLFDVIVTADDVARSKPDPESYLLVLSVLGRRYPGRTIRPAKVVAIEDTPAGIEAARRAGLEVIAVTNSHPAAKLQGASRIVESLDGVTINRLAEWFQIAGPDRG